MKHAKLLPPVEVLRDRFSYDPHTGELRAKHAHARHPAGRLVTRCTIDYEEHKSHRVIWKMMTGEDPYPLTVDHINRDHNDNRWCNLRLATQKLQIANRGNMDEDTRNILTNQRRKGTRYTALLTCPWKHTKSGRMALGTFSTLKVAQLVRDAAELGIYTDQ